ncbi:MAG TPA: hypothetical protein VGL29_00020, partial [Blastocatellia bacterium]
MTCSSRAATIPPRFNSRNESVEWSGAPGESALAAHTQRRPRRQVNAIGFDGLRVETNTLSASLIESCGRTHDFVRLFVTAAARYLAWF